MNNFFNQHNECKPAVWIITCPRSGSNYLSALLDKIIVGNEINNNVHFHEHFNYCLFNSSYYSNQIYKDFILNEINTEEHVDFLKKNNKIIIEKKLYPKYNKLMSYQVLEWKESYFDDIKNFLPQLKCIHLIRKDIYHQTISLYFAKKTKKYHFYNDKIENYLNCKIEFDENNILQFYNDFLYEKNKCFDIIKYLKCPYHTVYYEDLCENLDFELEKICDFLSIDKDKVKLIHTEEFQNKSSIKITHPLKEEYVERLKNIICKNIY